MPHHIQSVARRAAETVTRVSAVVETPEVAAPKAEPPKWDAKMKKADLLAIAQNLGLQVHETDTKAVIVAALGKAGSLTP